MKRSPVSQLFLFVLISKVSFMLCTKRAIVIGASSGMGREVAKRLAKEGYMLGLVARVAAK